MAKPLPTILFFAGAFADPSCFDTLSGHFQSAGYHTSYAYVPSLNPPDAPTVTTSNDAEQARNKYLMPLLDDGKEVVVFVHSYGGVVGGQAAAGLSKSARSAAGKPGGVIGLVYLVGNIVGKDYTLLQAVGGAYPPFIKENYVRPTFILNLQLLTSREYSPLQDLQSLIRSWIPCMGTPIPNSPPNLKLV